MFEEKVVAYLRIWLERDKSQNHQSSNRKLKPGPSKYEAAVLTNQPG